MKPWRGFESCGRCARGNTITGISRSSPQLGSRRMRVTGGRQGNSRCPIPIRIHDVLAQCRLSLGHKFTTIAAVVQLRSLAGPTLRCRPPRSDLRLGRSPLAEVSSVPRSAALSLGLGKVRPRRGAGRWCVPAPPPARGGLWGAPQRQGSRRAPGGSRGTKGPRRRHLIFLGPRRTRAASSGRGTAAVLSQRGLSHLSHRPK